MPDIARIKKYEMEEIRDRIKQEFKLYCEINGDLLYVEEYYESTGDEKNDDDCYDLARENGEMIVEKYPMLEIHDYYCHRHKWAYTYLKLKE